VIVDTHTHLFAPDPVRYPLAEPAAAYRPMVDGSVEVLKAQMDEAGVDRAVTISPWPYQWDTFPTAQYNTRMTYRQTVQVFSEAIALTDEERSWILGGTAAKLWRWG